MGYVIQAIPPLLGSNGLPVGAQAPILAPPGTAPTPAPGPVPIDSSQLDPDGQAVVPLSPIASGTGTTILSSLESGVQEVLIYIFFGILFIVLLYVLISDEDPSITLQKVATAAALGT